MTRPQIALRSLVAGDAAELLDLRVRNRDYLAPWEPLRSDTYWTVEAQQAEIERGIAETDAGRAFPFAIVEDSGEIVGRIALSNIVRGAWQNATIGYFVSEDRAGRGYCTEAVRLACAYAFDVAKLHRVQAAVIPRNRASARVVEKAGFRMEGRSLRYLLIGGAWEDHDIYALTVEDRPL